MGRKAKPIELHLVNGNKSRLTKAEIEQRQEVEKKIKPKTNRIKCPDWIEADYEAERKWKVLVKELKELDLITNVDVDALAAYCDAYSQYVMCAKIIRDEGLMVDYTNKSAETNRVPHPLLTKKKQLFEQMKSLAVEFGLTPSSRAKIAMPKEEPKEVSEFDRMFGDV